MPAPVIMFTPPYVFIPIPADGFRYLDTETVVAILEKRTTTLLVLPCNAVRCAKIICDAGGWARMTII